MPATLDTMSDAELDARLIRLYRQHRATSLTQREGWHSLIADVLDVQARRTEVALGMAQLVALDG